MIFFYLLLPILTYSIRGKHLHIIEYKRNNCKGLSNTYEYKINECMSLSNNDRYVYIECSGDTGDTVEFKIYNGSLCDELDLVESHEYSESHCYGKKRYQCVGTDNNYLFGKIIGGILMMMAILLCLIFVIGGGRRSYGSYRVHHHHHQEPVVQEPVIRVPQILIQSDVNINDEGL